MKINLKKSLKIFLLLFILLISIGLVSASDNNSIDSNNNDLILPNGDIYNIDDIPISDVSYEDAILDMGSSSNDLFLDNNLKTKSNSLCSNELSSEIEISHTGNDLLDIQTAINSANAGDTVSLGDYAYDIGDGQINITKRISLEGNGNTVINGTGGVKVGCVISVSGITGAAIKGIIFNNPEADLTYTDFDTLYGWTIRLDSSNNILIENCSFINFNREINIDGSNENTIRGCYFTGGATRVTNGNGKERGTRSISFSSNSWNNSITDNIFEGPVLDAINIDAAHNTLISRNTFINNSYAIFLDQSASDGAIISNNTFIDCGHFDAIYNGAKIHFEDLPIIDCAKSFSNLTIDNNIFYISSNNVVIYVDTTNEIGNVNITNNKIDLYFNYKDASSSSSSDSDNSSGSGSSSSSSDSDNSSGSGSSVGSADSSLSSSYDNITFIKFPSVESKLDLLGHIIISGTESLDDSLSSNLTYGNFGGSLHYLDDGDIIIYGPRTNTSLDVLFADKVYINSVLINFTLVNAKSSVGLDKTIIVQFNNETYNISMNNGFGQLAIAEDDIDSGNYTIEAKFLGDLSYGPSNSIKDLEILGHNTISVNHTGNDTADILNAINQANPKDIIDLGNYAYVLDTIELDKSLKFIGANASISLANDSYSIFYIENNDDLDMIDLELSDIVFKVNKNNETIVLSKIKDDISSFELDNITVVLDESLGNISNDTINLIRIESLSSQISFDKINLNNNKLLNGMKSVVISSVPLRKNSRIVYSNMTTTAVASADGRIGKYFEVILADENGNPLSDKLVQIGFNGKVYNRTTNSTGGASLQINLPKENLYTFAICFLGDDDYNGSFEVAVIKVVKQSPKLTASAKTFKSSSKIKSLTASFKTAKGNPVSGKTLQFTINGKTYSAKTNSKGVATVKVSLTKKGTYACTVKSISDNTFAITSAKFNVKIV